MSEPPGLDGIVLRPLASADAPDLRRIRATPEVARWWDPPEHDFPLADEPDATRLTIVVDGAVAGLIQFAEESEPKYRHASIDLFLDPSLHGRGIGTEAVRRVVRHLIEDRDHHRITIDPAAANEPAIRSYAKAGFQVVGVMRAYERDPDGAGWHDSLLMELVTLPEPTANAAGDRSRLASTPSMASDRASVALREAHPEDAAAVAEIWRNGWRDGHLGFVPDELIAARTDETFLPRASARVPETTVATVEGTVAGFIMVVDDEVEQVYVSALHRGTGVASVLIAEAERQVRAGGHLKAWLAVVAGNARARAFYERAGWRDEGPFDYAATVGGGSINVPCHRYTKLVGPEPE